MEAPHPLASLGPFPNERARLGWLVPMLMKQAGKTDGFPDDVDEELSHVLTALVMHGLHLASGVSILLNEGVHGAPGAVERSLYEVWCEIREVLDQGPLGAQKMLVNSMMELAEADATSDYDKHWALRYATAVEEVEKEYPDAVQEVRKQRSKRQFHWSGKSRSALMRHGSPKGQMYTLLSWEGHAVHVALRDAVTQMLSGDFEKTRVYPAAMAEYMDPEAVAFRCSAYLSDMWGRCCRFIGVPELNWPQIDESDKA